jgi:hypothetical protein
MFRLGFIFLGSPQEEDDYMESDNEEASDECTTDYPQGTAGESTRHVCKHQGLGLSSLRDVLTCRPSPKIRASRPCLVRHAEAGKEVD